MNSPYTQDTYYLKEIGTPKWYHPSTAAIPFSVEHRKVLDADGNDTGKTELQCITAADHQQSGDDTDPGGKGRSDQWQS